jgi:hypothetical protein
MRAIYLLVTFLILFAGWSPIQSSAAPMQRDIKPEIHQHQDHDHHNHDCSHDHHDHDCDHSEHDHDGHTCAHDHPDDHDCGHHHHHHGFEEFMTDCHVDHGEGFTGLLKGVFKHTITVTIFVLMMLLLIEYLTVMSRGSLTRFFTKRNWLQIVFAAVLGVIPGCLGVYVAVSLYAHHLFSFAALVTAMIATSGDEAFVMIGVMPRTALIIFGSLFLIAIATGFIVHIFMKNRTLMPNKEAHIQLHQDDPHCSVFNRQLILPQLRLITFERALLLFGNIAFIVGLLSGDLGMPDWSGTRTTFLIISIFGLFLFTTTPDHFLRKHLWGHVIKKHFLKIFLWTFAAFTIIHIIIPYLDLTTWLETNLIYVLLIAVLIGILPESGPHLVFVVLFLEGGIPFSILLANSIVQDGHGALPLLAESKRSFVVMKVINLLVGLIVGLIGFYMGW